MVRKIFLFIFLSIFCLNLSSAEEAGYALLDKLVLTFKHMAEHGTGGIEKVDYALDEIMAEAKEAKAQGQIDPAFFRRFHRILIVLKLSLIEDRGILWPLIMREIGEFVEDIKGEKWDIKGKKGIGTISDAVAEEIINLHMYLDNKKNRDKLREELKEKFSLGKK